MPKTISAESAWRKYRRGQKYQNLEHMRMNKKYFIAIYNFIIAQLLNA